MTGETNFFCSFRFFSDLLNILLLRPDLLPFSTVSGVVELDNGDGRALVAFVIGPGYKGVAARTVGGLEEAAEDEREDGLFSRSDLSLEWEFLRISVFKRAGGTKEATEGSSSDVGTVGGLRVLGVETGNVR